MTLERPGRDGTRADVEALGVVEDESHAEKSINPSPRILHDVNIQCKCIGSVGDCDTTICRGLDRGWVIAVVYERAKMWTGLEILILVIDFVLLLILRTSSKRLLARGNLGR